MRATFYLVFTKQLTITSGNSRGKRAEVDPNVFKTTESIIIYHCFHRQGATKGDLKANPPISFDLVEHVLFSKPLGGIISIRALVLALRTWGPVYCSTNQRTNK